MYIYKSKPYYRFMTYIKYSEASKTVVQSILCVRAHFFYSVPKHTHFSVYRAREKETIEYRHLCIGASSFRVIYLFIKTNSRIHGKSISATVEGKQKYIFSLIKQKPFRTNSFRPRTYACLPFKGHRHRGWLFTQGTHLYVNCSANTQ